MFFFFFIFIFSRPVIEVFFQCIQDIVVVLTKKKKHFQGFKSQYNNRYECFEH